MSITRRAWRRRLSYGSNATLVTGMVVALVVVFHGIMEHHRLRWDLSEGGAATMSAETLHKVKLLEGDGEPVTVTAFSQQPGRPESILRDREVRGLLHELEVSSPTLHTRFVDYDRDRLTADALGVREYGAMVVQRGEDRVDIKPRELFRARGRGADRQLQFLGEGAVSQAFSRLMTRTRRVAYSLVGHGEPDISSMDPGGLAGLGELLERESYQFKALDLVREAREGAAPKVPEDADVLVLAGPRVGLTEPEEAAVLEYLSRGGALMVLVDVGLPAPSVLSRLGVSVPAGYVMDLVRVFPYDDRPVPVYRAHPITEDLLDSQLVTVVAHAAPLVQDETLPVGVRAAPLMGTRHEGWIERGGSRDRGAAVYDEGVDEKGPVTMAIALEVAPGAGLVDAGRPAARIVVAGDVDMATNSILAEGPGNATFLLNAARWLVGDDQRLSVVLTPTRVRKLALTDRDAAMMRWLTMGLLPILAMVAGVMVQVGRRGR